MADVNCHKILVKALNADEAGDKVITYFDYSFHAMIHHHNEF